MLWQTVQNNFSETLSMTDTLIFTLSILKYKDNKILLNVQRTWIAIYPKKTFKHPTRIYETILNITNHQGSANQKHETPPNTNYDGYYQEVKIASVGENMRNSNPCSPLVEERIGTAVMETSMESPEKIKN